MKFLRKALRRYGSPDVMVTDRYRSYDAALKELGARDIAAAMIASGHGKRVLPLLRQSLPDLLTLGAGSGHGKDS